MTEPMIEIEGVTKAYDGRRVVDELSLSIPPGSLCVLLGPSGCGKSTTLRMINRLIAFDSGMIRVGGEDVRRVPPQVLRRRIGYAIQSIGLFPHWRVEDNIATVPRLLGWPRSRVRDRVIELLELLRLDPETYRNKYPHQLSGGEQQRVGGGRAPAPPPPPPRHRASPSRCQPADCGAAGRGGRRGTRRPSSARRPRTRRASHSAPRARYSSSARPRTATPPSRSVRVRHRP